MEDKDLPSPG